MTSLHRLRLFAAGGLLVALCLSAAFTPWQVSAAGKTPSRWALFTPDHFSRIETITTKQRERKYYVVTPAKPLEFTVNGPTTLRVGSRLLYTVDMKGIQQYSITVTEQTGSGRDREVTSATFSAHKSTTSTASQSSLVPSRGDRLTVVVPGGRHHYRLHLSGTVAAEAAIRILIPKKDIAS